MSEIDDATARDAAGQPAIWPLNWLFTGLFCGDALDGASLWFFSMVIRVRCRQPWLSALMRTLRNEVFPVPLRRHLIVVDQPKVMELPQAVGLTTSVDLAATADLPRVA